MDHVNVPAKFGVRSFTVPEIIAIGVLGGGCDPHCWGTGGRRGQGWYRSKQGLIVPGSKERW